MTSRKVISREQRQCSQIRPFLYVAGLSGLSPNTLSKFSVIINTIPGFRLIAPNHLRIVNVPMQDDEHTDLTPFWQLIFKEIEDCRKSGGRCMLLCAMGISRSATFAIGYLMCIEKLSLRDSYKHVQMCRNIVCPNIGFFQQLIVLEKKIHSNTSVSILEPIKGVKIADVVWQELYDEMMETMSEADRHSLRSLNMNVESARLSGDIRSVRSLNVINEHRVDDLSQSIATCRLSSETDGSSSHALRPAPLQRARTEPPPVTFIPKSALRDKTKATNEKKKKWRLSFSKDVR